MRSPLDMGIWVSFDEVSSTQTVAAEHLLRGEPVGVIFARHQNAGKGRFSREWVSSEGDSLTMSLIFRDYVNHPAPHLIGMGVATAAAAVLHCELQWPNDLVFEGKKVGGVLTELLPNEKGQSTPVVGVGINLNQKTFPLEIADRATSLAIYSGGVYEPEAMGRAILDRLPKLPELLTWADLKPVWMLFDHTPGKSYRMADGNEGVALGVGPEGALICAVNGESTSVMAAEAIFGAQSTS